MNPDSSPCSARVNRVNRARSAVHRSGLPVATISSNWANSFTGTKTRGALPHWPIAGLDPSESRWNYIEAASLIICT